VKLCRGHAPGSTSHWPWGRNTGMLARADVKRLLVWDPLGALAFGLIVGYFTGDFRYAITSGLCAIYGVEVFWGLYQRFVRPRIQGLPRLRKVLIEIAASFLNHFLGIFIGITIALILFGYFSVGVIVYLIPLALVGPVFHSVEYARMFYRELRETELQEERLKALAAQAELKALKAQINPHFLFNTLNTIAHLIRTDPAKAESMVERLAEVFRYALFALGKDAVRLEEELDFIRSYLDLEKERFGDKLQVVLATAAETESITVPPLILQPLVENALKHGQGGKGEVQLAVATSLGDETVDIEITDQGPGMVQHGRKPYTEGTGLRNVRERLKKTYGEGHVLEIGPNVPRGTRVTVRIPRERS
jgi:signal transduction histidine kinase